MASTSGVGLAATLAWAQSSDGLSPSSRDPFSGTNIPATMLRRGICGLQIRWDAGGIGNQRASWTWLSSRSCSPWAERSTVSPGRHKGGRVGFTPVVFCSPDPSLSWGAGTGTLFPSTSLSAAQQSHGKPGWWDAAAAAPRWLR